MPVLTSIAQDAFVAAVRTLVAQVDASGWRPAFVIGIGRGGLVPAVFLSHAGGWPMLSVDYSSRVPDFASEPLLKLARRSANGERLLLVDDINDTGRTLAAIRAALRDGGAAMDRVRIATLLSNSRSPEPVDYAARVIDRAVTKDWFVFPWEAVAPDAAIAQDAAAVPERTA